MTVIKRQLGSLTVFDNNYQLYQLVLLQLRILGYLTDIKRQLVKFLTNCDSFTSIKLIEKRNNKINSN